MFTRRWSIGAQIYDMHEGWKQIHEECEVKDVIIWDTDIIQADYFLALLEGARKAGNHTSYTNKMVTIIGYSHSDDSYVVAWSYDGRQVGVCKLKPKTQLTEN